MEKSNKMCKNLINNKINLAIFLFFLLFLTFRQFCNEKKDSDLCRNDSMEDIPLSDEAVFRKMSELKV